MLNKRSSKLALGLAAILSLLSLGMTSAPSDIQVCKLELEILARPGSENAIHLKGEVNFGQGDTSNLIADLVEESGAAHPMTFALNGLAVNFILPLEAGKLYGSGMMESTPATCIGSGGGTLSGPGVGDLGDWRGTWVRGTIPIPDAPTVQPPAQPQPQAPVEPKNQSFLDIVFEVIGGLCFSVLIFYIALLFFRVSKPFRTSKKPTVDSMRRPGTKRDGTRSGMHLPLVEYVATYVAGDKLFDLSVDIDLSGRYLGECGISASYAGEKAQGMVTDFEVWVFDSGSTETPSKNLIRERSFPLTSSGDAPTVQIETRNLVARAEMLSVEYQSGDSNAAIQKAVIKLTAWRKSDSAEGL